MPSLSVTLNGNVAPLLTTLKVAESASIASAKRIEAATTTGTGHAKAGVISESLVLLREASRGNFSRMAGSVTILAQRLGILNAMFKDSATVATITAGAYEKVALESSLAEVAALRKAQASDVAFTADLNESAASLEQAVADEAAAGAATAHANAMRAKAVAAGEAAAAQSAEAVSTGGGSAGGGVMLPVLAAVLVVAATLYERIWGIKSMSKSLSGETPEITDTYIPLLKRHLSDVKNEQREITDEIRKTTDAYMGAAAQAERISKATKEHYDFQKRMNQLSNVPEAIKSANEVKIDAEQRNTELANKINEATSLENEARTAQAKADAIKVTTKEEDQETAKQLDKNAADAEKLLSNSSKLDEFKRQAATQLAGDPDETAQKMVAAEEAGRAAAQQRIKEADKFKDKEAANDELRKVRESLVQEAVRAAGAAAAAQLAIPDLRKANAQADADEKKEAQAKLLHSGGRGEAAVTEREKIGLGAASGVQVQLLDVTKLQHQEMKMHTTKLQEIIQELKEGGF